MTRISRLVLASASPQRKALLEGLGVPFEIVVSAVDEDSHPETDPRHRSIQLAELKARDVAAKNKGAVVIGCDTLVVSGMGELLEKPKDEADARRMIKAHGGDTCLVHSALCVVGADGKAYEGVSTSSVTFKPLTDKEIDWWIGTKLWQGRSGGFQIDGPGQLLISHIEGDWTSIVGLPVYLLGQLLEKAGYSFQEKVGNERNQG